MLIIVHLNNAEVRLPPILYHNQKYPLENFQLPPYLIMSAGSCILLYSSNLSFRDLGVERSSNGRDSGVKLKIVYALTRLF